MAEEKQYENPEKTYTQADIDALKQAKDHERDAANAANAKIKELEKQILDLQSKNYGDEEKIKNAPLYKAMELENAKLTEDYSKLNNKIKEMTSKIEDSELATLIGKNEFILPSAIDDAVTQARAAGFQKTEKGWISSEGKSLVDFLNDLKTLKPHYWKRTVGNKQPYFSGEKLQETKKQHMPVREMLTELYKQNL